MGGIFLNNWELLEEMQDDFWPDFFNSHEEYPYKGELEGINVLLASYGTPGAEGNAFVLFEQDEKLYEVNASHCSIYGLEGQWDPEGTSVAELLHRMEKGHLGEQEDKENPFAHELRIVLDDLEKLGFK